MIKHLKKIFNILGLIIFIFTITNEIDGIGRFVCILFATTFLILGTFLKEKGENNE